MCRSGCASQDHESYSACLKDANLHVAYCNSAAGKDYSAQKKWDATLESYDSARAQGIQPAGTSRRQIEQAVRLSDEHGVAARATA